MQVGGALAGHEMSAEAADTRRECSHQETHGGNVRPGHQSGDDPPVWTSLCLLPALADCPTEPEQHQQQQQQPAPYGDERCGHGSAQEQPPPPSLEEAEQALLRLLPGSDQGAASPQQLAAWHDRFKAAAGQMAGLEQLASAATLQYLDAQGGCESRCLSGRRLSVWPATRDHMLLSLMAVSYMRSCVVL